VAIKINNLEEISNKLARNTYLYKDIHLDIEKEYTIVYPKYVVHYKSDIIMDTDIEAINNSIKNLLTTIPGQRFLFPKYGLNLATYLFEPITPERARILGDEIVTCINTFEPRIRINLCQVEFDADNYTYDIKLSVEYKDFNKLETLGVTLNQTAKTINFIN
jgi:phage baseplate assembly protein W